MVTRLLFLQNSHPIHRQLLSSLCRLPQPCMQLVIESLISQVSLDPSANIASHLRACMDAILALLARQGVWQSWQDPVARIGSVSLS